MARVSPIVALHPDMGAVRELVGSYQRCWMDFKDRHWRQPKEPANPHGSLHVPHASLYGLLRSCLTRVAASVILCSPFKMKRQVEMRLFLRRSLNVLAIDSKNMLRFQETLDSSSSKSMHWCLGVLRRMPSKDENSKNITVSEMANSSETNSANTFTSYKKASCASSALNKLQVQMTKIPKESADQKDLVWYYHGSCMPKTLLWSKTTLLGGSTWLSKCVRALHFPLLGFETYCSNSLSMSSLHTANRTVNKILEFQLCERGCSLSEAFEGTRQPSFHKPTGMVELRWFSNGPRVDGFNMKLQHR